MRANTRVNKEHFNYLSFPVTVRPNSYNRFAPDFIDTSFEYTNMSKITKTGKT